MARLIKPFCFLTLIGLGSGLAGCTRLPTMDAAISRETAKADYPDFLTMGELQALAIAESAGSDPTDDLQARSARLRARAAALLLTTP